MEKMNDLRKGKSGNEYYAGESQKQAPQPRDFVDIPSLEGIF